MNRWVGVGRLTRDPEKRYTQGAEPLAVTRYTVAVDRRGRQKEGEPTADFIQCVAFGKAAEFASSYFRQGMRVAVEGRIQTGKYTNREGATVFTTEVVVDAHEFAQSKSENQQQAKPETSGGFMDPADDSGLPWS